MPVGRLLCKVHQPIWYDIRLRRVVSRGLLNFRSSFFFFIRFPLLFSRSTSHSLTYTLTHTACSLSKNSEMWQWHTHHAYSEYHETGKHSEFFFLWLKLKSLNYIFKLVQMILIETVKQHLMRETASNQLVSSWSRVQNLFYMEVYVCNLCVCVFVCCTLLFLSLSLSL